MPAAGNATSRICSSCSHTSFLSSATPGEAAPAGSARFHAAIQTCRSSPLRASSTSRYCDWFSESVRRSSATGATSLTRRPASFSAAAKRAARLAEFGRPHRGGVAVLDRDRLACTGESCGLVRQIARSAVQVFSGMSARRDEEQERAETRVPSLHGCDHNTSRCSPPVMTRMTPRRQPRATKNATGNVIAAIRTQPEYFP